MLLITPLARLGLRFHALPLLAPGTARAFGSLLRVGTVLGLTATARATAVRGRSGLRFRDALPAATGVLRPAPARILFVNCVAIARVHVSRFGFGDGALAVFRVPGCRARALAGPHTSRTSVLTGLIPPPSRIACCRIVRRCSSR